ncbi:hypothetical protein GCM10029964_114570 [Kibdelosporangium lantanae]
MASGSHADAIAAALKPTNGKDVKSTDELQRAFAWFRDNLPAKPGKLGEIYQRWMTHPAAKGGWTAQPWGPDDDKLLDDLGGIDFGPLQGDAQRFGNLRGASEEFRQGAEGIRNRLHDAWSGPAAQTALDTLDKLGKASASFRDTLNQFAAALDLARQTTRDAITHVQQSGIKPFELPHGVDFRREQIRRLDMAIAGQPPYERPYSPVELKVPAKVDLNIGSWEKWWSNEVINALDAMCDSYANAVGPLRQLLTDTTTAITNSWTTLGDVLKRLSSGDIDPFAKVKAAPPQSTAPSSAGGGVTVDDGQRKITTGHDAQGNLTLDVDHPGSGGAQNLTHEEPGQTSGAGTGGSGSGGAGSGGSHGGGGGGHAGGGGAGGGGGGGGGVGSSQQQPLGPGGMAGAQQPAASPEQQPAAAAATGKAAGGPGQGGGGGMPMGGMAGMGAGGGQGGDQERKPSRWRTQGDLFDDAASEVVPMVIGDIDPYEAKETKGKK